MSGAITRRWLMRHSLGLGAAAALGAAGASCAPAESSLPAAHPGPCRPVSRLPGRTMSCAWTVDDGVDLATLQAYVNLVSASAVPLTFCATHALADNWEQVRRPLRKLVAAESAQLVNHTWSHRVLTELSDEDVRAEIQQNEEWIQQTFRVTSRPYLRPPEGKWDSRVARLCGELGFTTLLLWDASLNDASAISTDALLANADQAFFPGAVILGHANVPTVSRLFDRLLTMVDERGLQPVTLDQAFGTSRAYG